eukprot:Seg1826.4 transcript_id=Seg1826.4/GoldUCD/mRNA.D3Y31 product="G-protein coupled receptor 26" protein_id=Seg1826.4/GoldUCD/D3Y31
MMSVSIAERAIFTMYYLILGVFGLIANAGIFVILCRSKDYRRRLSTYYLYSVLLSRLLACIIEIPYYTFSVIANLPEPDGNAFETECRVCLFFTFSISTLKIFVLVGMSLDRFVAVMYPYFYNSHMTTVKVRMINAFLWIAAFVITIPLSAKPNLGRYYGHIGASCRVNYNVVSKAYFFSYMILGFISPAAIMAVTNTKVFLVAREQKSEIHNESTRHGMRIREMSQENEGVDRRTFHVRESGSMINQNGVQPSQQGHSSSLHPNHVAGIMQETRITEPSLEKRDTFRNLLHPEDSGSILNQNNVPSHRQNYARAFHGPIHVTAGPSRNPEAINNLDKVPGALCSPKGFRPINALYSW